MYKIKFFCQFCGNENTTMRQYDGYYWVNCSNCGCLKGIELPKEAYIEKENKSVESNEETKSEDSTNDKKKA